MSSNYARLFYYIGEEGINIKRKNVFTNVKIHKKPFQIYYFLLNYCNFFFRDDPIHRFDTSEPFFQSGRNTHWKQISLSFLLVEPCLPPTQPFDRDRRREIKVNTLERSSCRPRRFVPRDYSRHLRQHACFTGRHRVVPAKLIAVFPS